MSGTATEAEFRAVIQAAERALNAGDAAVARQLLESAVEKEPQNPRLWLSLAIARRVQRDADGEMAALDKALAADPYMFLALLQKATLLERLGKPKQAAKVYHAFLTCAPTTNVPQALHDAMAKARKAVQADSAALEVFLKSHMSAARARHAESDLRRADDCVDVLLGKKRVFVQQPTFMHFPYVPAIQFYNRADFPWLDTVEAATPDIRDELVRLLAEESQEFKPYINHPDWAPLNQWKDLNKSRKWSALYLWREGTRVDENCKRCPKTAAVMEKLPLADVPGHAPSVFFSLLEPRTHIPPHTGVTNTRVIVHLPLILPQGCRFRVGSETREWEVGKAWVFDDTMEHEAINDSDEPRAILIFDTWNPHLTEAERDLVRAATDGVAAYYGGE